MPRGELLDGLMLAGRNETIGTEDWYRKSLIKDVASLVGSPLSFHEFLNPSQSFSDVF